MQKAIRECSPRTSLQKAPNASIEIFLAIDLFIVSLELKSAISKSILLILSLFIPNRPQFLADFILQFVGLLQEFHVPNLFFKAYRGVVLFHRFSLQYRLATKKPASQRASIFQAFIPASSRSRLPRHTG